MPDSAGLLPAGEVPISLSELVKAIERRPPLNTRTLQMWIEVGVRGARDDGPRIRLEAEKHGNIWYTSIEAYQRFRAACNQQ